MPIHKPAQEPLARGVFLCNTIGMKNLNAYTILDNARKDLQALYDREDARHLMDSDLVTGHLDDLGEIIDQLDALVFFDGAS